MPRAAAGHGGPLGDVFTALIWDSDRGSFPYALEGLQGKRICVKGVIELYKGKAEIIVTGPSQIEVQK